MTVEADKNTSETGEILFGRRKIRYHVLRRQRKTLQIAVLPDSTVEITAPMESTPFAIQDKIKKRGAWIVKQQHWFRQFDPRTPARQYLGGESHFYLGKRYRLKVMAGSATGVRLVHGFFEVTCSEQTDPEQVKTLMDQWYKKKASSLFSELFACLQQQYRITKVPLLQIKKMKMRWGSLSKGGILTLNTNLIQAPKECIEYVVTHELCHIQHHNHSTEFYKLLTRRMPDWMARKQILEGALI